MAAHARESKAGHVNNIKVISDKIEDVTSIEALLDWISKPGMSDKAKGLAAWETVVKFRHQEPPPREYLPTRSRRLWTGYRC